MSLNLICIKRLYGTNKLGVFLKVQSLLVDILRPLMFPVLLKCMCLCVNVCVCVRTCVYTHVYMSVCDASAHVFMCMCVHISACMHVNMDVYLSPLTTLKIKTLETDKQEDY